MVHSGMKLFVQRFAWLGIVVIALLVSPAAAPAITYDFRNLTTPEPSGSIADQLFMDVLDLGGGQVLFNFRNTGPDRGSIFTVAFDDNNQLLSDIEVINSPGVDFDGSKNGPAIEPITPSFDNDWVAKKSGGAANGVGLNEWVGIRFAGNYNSVLADLLSQQLRVGLHVGDLTKGASQKLVNEPSAKVPEGAMTLTLLGMGFVSLELLRRRLFA